MRFFCLNVKSNAVISDELHVEILLVSIESIPAIYIGHVYSQRM